MTEEYIEQTGWLVGRMIDCDNENFTVVGVFTTCQKARKHLTDRRHFMLPFIFNEPIDQNLLKRKFPCEHVEGVPETSYL